MRISDAAAQKAVSRTAAALTARSVAGQSPMPMPLQNSWTPAPHQLHSAPSAEATTRWAAALTVTARLLRGGGGSAEGGGGGGSTETDPASEWLATDTEPDAAFDVEGRASAALGGRQRGKRSRSNHPMMSLSQRLRTVAADGAILMARR